MIKLMSLSNTPPIFAIGNEKIDMKRMQNILERCLLECHSNLESAPHEAVAFPVIADILYGQHDKDVRMM